MSENNTSTEGCCRLEYLTAYKCLDPFSAILGKEPQPVHVMGAIIDAELCK